jgi:hypothetical protein
MPIARDKRLVGKLFFVFFPPIIFPFKPFSIVGRAEVITKVTSKLMAGESSRILIHGDISASPHCYSPPICLSINIGNLA